MAQSQEILYLLDLIDEIDGMSIDFLWSFLHDEVKETYGSLSKLFKFLDAEKVKNLKAVRSLVGEIAKTKLVPSRELNNEFIEKVFSLMHKGDALLDEHFTRLELQRVPGTVARWKKLCRIPIVLIPGEKVTEYMRQATTCYLYGLPSAAAVLCRTVLELALEEKLGEVGGISRLTDKVNKKDHLYNLIKLAGMTKAGKTKILPDELATKANSIRKVGNDAIHESMCDEGKALETIKKTGEVLSHFYGRTDQKGR